MQLSAKLVQLLPLQTGSGKNGTWKKQDIIVETEGQYPKKVCISIWGDKIDESVLKVGSQLNISFDVESREYNGKWYTDVKAWKVEGAATMGANSHNNAPSSFEDNSFAGMTPPPEGDSDDDLPF